MSKSDTKVMEVIKGTEKWLEQATSKEKYSDYGMTVYGCESRNLQEYKEMLGQDKRQLSGRLRELYRSIE